LNYYFKIYNDIEKLKDEWIKINESNNEVDIFQLYIYNYIWCINNPDVNFSIYVCYMDNKVVGIIPLYEDEKKNKNYVNLTNIGSNYCHFDYSNIITIDEYRKDLISAWLIHLKNTQTAWDVISFKGIKNNWFLSCLNEANLNSQIELKKTYKENFIIYLENDFTSYLNKLGKKIKKGYFDFKLIKKYDDSIILYEDNSLKAIEEFKKIHTLRWNKVGSKGIFSDNQFDFFKMIAETNYFHMLFLKSKNEILGSICYFDYNKCRYFYQSAIERDINKSIKTSISIGKILILSAIKNAYELGFEKFDFMDGKEIYKYNYTHTTYDVINLSIYNKNSKSVIDSKIHMDLQIATKLKLSKMQQNWSLVKSINPEIYKLPLDKHILIVAPHFDDEIIGCGGLIQYCNKNNCMCDVLFMTNGDDGSSSIHPKLLVDIRKKESKNAKKIIGYYNEYYLDIKDGFLHDDKIIRKQVEKLVDLNKYSQIFVTPEYDSHNDHREAYKIINSILKNTKYSKKEVFVYESIEILKNPNTYLNVKDFYEKK